MAEVARGRGLRGSAKPDRGDGAVSSGSPESRTEARHGPPKLRDRCPRVQDRLGRGAATRQDLPQKRDRCCQVRGIPGSIHQSSGTVHPPGPWTESAGATQAGPSVHRLATSGVTWPCPGTVRIKFPAKGRTKTALDRGMATCPGPTYRSWLSASTNPATLVGPNMPRPIPPGLGRAAHVGRPDLAAPVLLLDWIPLRRSRNR